MREPDASDGGAETDAEGRYSVLAEYIHVDEAELCAAVVATPPAGMTLRPDTAAVGLTVRHQSRVPPLDSARLDFVLRSNE